jgi:hypothetical protein
MCPVLPLGMGTKVVRLQTTVTLEKHIECRKFRETARTNHSWSCRQWSGDVDDIRPKVIELLVVPFREANVRCSSRLVLFLCKNNREPQREARIVQALRAVGWPHERVRSPMLEQTLMNVFVVVRTRALPSRPIRSRHSFNSTWR